jgi:hypothetical protein
MAKGFATMVDKVVTKEKENSLNAPAAAATGASNTKTPGVLANKTPSVIPPPANGAATAAFGADQRRTKADANWDKVTNVTKMAGVVAKNQRAAAGQKLFTRKLVSAMTWEIFSPPPLNSVSGKIVPRVLNRYKNRRLVSLEVHLVTPHIDDTDVKKGKESARSYEECVLR